MIAATGHARRNIGLLDLPILVAEAARLGKQLHVRAEAGHPGRLVWVLDIGADMELTADYLGAS
jgi:hypothetical protein